MNNAYITLLSTNNYLYGCIGLMYSWKKTNSKYPFYCIVTEDITDYNVQILEAIGYNIIRDKLYIPNSYYTTLKNIESNILDTTPTGNSTADLTKNGWQYGWTKLHIFKYTDFDRLLFIDADSYVVQNLDSVFEYPGWASVCEYDSPWRGTTRFLSSFMLVEPNLKIYNDLLQLAEDKPLIEHPVTGQLQLSNDYDLLNLYKSNWHQYPELILPNYTYIDSFGINSSDFMFPFILNSFYKVKAIHLTGDKPWIQGSSFVEDIGGEWGLWRELYLLYIKYLNKCLEDICHKGIASLPLVK